MEDSNIEEEEKPAPDHRAEYRDEAVRQMNLERKSL